MQEKFEQVLKLAQDNIASFGGGGGDSPELENELLLGGDHGFKPVVAPKLTF